MVTPPRNTKYAPGSGTKPSVAASGVKGKTTPISTTSTVVTASGRLGRLRKGLPAVRMTKSTSVRTVNQRGSKVRVLGGPRAETRGEHVLRALLKERLRLRTRCARRARRPGLAGC